MKFSARCLLLILILFLGAAARFTELAWHFTNVDDIGVAEIILANRVTREFGPFPIPRFYTYAPFQFLFTPFLISEHQTYRELLFWGRLPSCFFGILGFAGLIGFSRKFWGANSANVFLPLILLGCSWENIIYAKQMHNYALGVTATIFMFFLLAHHLTGRPLSLKALLMSAFCLAFLSHMHYQVLIYVPCFFLIFLILGLKYEKPKRLFLRNLALAGLAFVLMIFPMWFFFLKNHLILNAGAPDWGRGNQGEFVLSIAPGQPLFSAILTTLRFYAGNFLAIFQSHTAFIPEDHFLFLPVSYLLLGLLGLGVWSYLRTADVGKRLLGLFMGSVLCLWMILVAKNKLTFGPTRHTLILLPFFLITISEGLDLMIRRFFLRSRSDFIKQLGESLPFVLVFFVGVLFSLSYDRFLNERRDPFVESHILRVLRQYDVRMIIANQRTDQLHLMKSVQRYEAERSADESRRYDSIAWISRRDIRMNYETCEIMRERVNREVRVNAAESSSKLPFMKYPCRDYRVVYAKRIPSDLQVDFSNKVRTGIYTNSFYFYIVERMPS